MELEKLRKIKKLHKYQRSYVGLIDAKYVNVKKERVCACCNKVINKGQRALTASYPYDKKYHVSYRRAYDNNCVEEYKYVLIRHWVHNDCVDFMINEANRVEIKDVWYTRMNYDDIDLDNLDDDEALEVLNYFYEKGEITPQEYKIMEEALIDAIAFRDAMGIGQE